MPALVGGFGNKNNSKILLSSNIKKDTRPFSSSFQRVMSFMQKELSNFKFMSTMSLSLKGREPYLNLKHQNSSGCGSAPQAGLKINNHKLGSYLAGLIEGDGTFAVHNKLSTAKKYYPMIIVVFKINDLPLAEYLKSITNCGNIYNKPNRGYVLWQIQDIVGIFTIVNLINGYMRTPKIEALQRTIEWLNNYIDQTKSSNGTQQTTNLILSKIYKIESKSLDTSAINSNGWLSGFSDADANFSINIHKRSNKNLTRVQLYYRLEIRQTYKNSNNVLQEENALASQNSYFYIMSILSNFLGVNMYSRNRIINNKQFFSFTVMAHNKQSQLKLIDYFTKFPLLSSKYLDYKDWLFILEKQIKVTSSNKPAATESFLSSGCGYNKAVKSLNPPFETVPSVECEFKLNKNKIAPLAPRSAKKAIVTSYLEEALKIRKDFNKTRTTYNWDHLKNCYLTKIH